MTFGLGFLTGFLIGNLSLGLYTASLTVLIMGLNVSCVFITVLTILLVHFTGNVNFELIYILVITLIHLISVISNKRKYKMYLYFAVGVFLLIMVPLIQEILGSIPASILNDINISGEILLLCGIIFTSYRIVDLYRKRELNELVIYLTSFLLAFIGIKGTSIAVYLWWPGIVLLIILKYFKTNTVIKNKSRIEIYRYINNQFLNFLFFISLILPAIYSLLPLKMMVLLLGLILFTYIYFRPDNWSYDRLDLVYFSLLLGLIAAQMGLLT